MLLATHETVREPRHRESVDRAVLRVRGSAMATKWTFSRRSLLQAITSQEHEIDDDVLTPEQTARLGFLMGHLTQERLADLVENFPTPQQFYDE